MNQTKKRLHMYWVCNQDCGIQAWVVARKRSQAVNLFSRHFGVEKDGVTAYTEGLLAPSHANYPCVLVAAQG